MFKNLLSVYNHRYPKALVSLMYASKYNAASYLSHLHKTKDFSSPLESPAPRNKKTIIAINLLTLGILLQIAAGILVIILGLTHHIVGGVYFGVAIILLYPFTAAYLAALGLVVRAWYIYGSSLDKAK